jgi:predicted glycosyltransferase involved in capsule biosynthesis
MVVNVVGGVQIFPMTKPASLDIIEVLVCRAAKLEDHMERSLIASNYHVVLSHFVSLQVVSMTIC